MKTNLQRSQKLYRERTEKVSNVERELLNLRKEFQTSKDISESAKTQMQNRINSLEKEKKELQEQLGQDLMKTYLPIISENIKLKQQQYSVNSTHQRLLAKSYSLQKDIESKKKELLELENELAYAHKTSTPQKAAAAFSAYQNYETQKSEIQNRLIQKEKDYKILHTKLLDLEKSSGDKITSLTEETKKYTEKIQDLERNKVVQENQIRMLEKYKESQQLKSLEQENIGKQKSENAFREIQEAQTRINNLESKIQADDITLTTIRSLLSQLH